VLPSKHACPVARFMKTGSFIRYETWSGQRSLRRYSVGKLFIVVETLCEMKRPIYLWPEMYGQR
jgi:hypothetical protein